MLDGGASKSTVDFLSIADGAGAGKSRLIAELPEVLVRAVKDVRNDPGRRKAIKVAVNQGHAHVHIMASLHQSQKQTQLLPWSSCCVLI